jgi:nitrous oxidase accessory protein NosD
MADVTIVATEGIRVQHYGNGISCFTTTIIAVAISDVAK